MEPLITGLKFIPVRRVGSHIGFVKFVYEGNLAMKDIAVHERADKKSFRLVYPLNTFPINKETQEIIDNEVNCYIKQNCKIYL